MPDEAIPQQPQPIGAVRINLADDAKRAYWVACLGVTEDRLRQIVAEVGPLAKDVRIYLGKP